jgi:hypothetical protein
MAAWTHRRCTRGYKCWRRGTQKFYYVFSIFGLPTYRFRLAVLYYFNWFRPSMPSIPTHFPGLPSRAASDSPWGHNICKAHTIISGTYSRATQLLRQEDGDALRLRIHSEKIFKRIIPLLKALEPEISNTSWITECTHALARVMVSLEEAAYAADGVYVHSQLDKY